MPDRKFVAVVNPGAWYQVRAGRILFYPPKIVMDGEGGMVRWANGGDFVKPEHPLEVAALEQQRAKLRAVGRPTDGSIVRGADKHPPTFARAMRDHDKAAAGEQGLTPAEALAALGGDGGDDEPTIDPSKAKVQELRELLTAKGIEIPAEAKKADLIALAEKALAGSEA